MRKFFSCKVNFLRKGQIKLDFIFALVFFVAIVFYIEIHVNNVLTSALTDSRLDTLKSEADLIMDVLIYSEGLPANWETLTEDKVIQVGLANVSYNLSSAKISALNSNCNLMNKFGNINYRLTVFSGNSIFLSCGYGGPRVTSKAERAVAINGNYGKIILEMW